MPVGNSFAFSLLWKQLTLSHKNLSAAKPKGKKGGKKEKKETGEKENKNEEEAKKEEVVKEPLVLPMRCLAEDKLRNEIMETCSLRGAERKEARKQGRKNETRP